MNDQIETDDELVGTLCAYEQGLTGWEVDFTESIASQVEAGRRLSEAQRAKALEIIERLEADRG